MKVIEITTPGEPQVLQPGQRPQPVAGPGEVLIRVAASGVNRPDVLQRKGRYAPPPGTSDIPGLTPPTWASVLAHDYETWNTPPFYIDTAQLSPDDAVCQIISHLHSI